MFCGEPAAVFRYADGNHFVFLLIDCIQNGRCRQQRHFMLAAASAKKDANPKLCHIISSPGNYSCPSQSIASSRVFKVTIWRREKFWKFSMNACGMLSVPTHAVFFTNGRSSVSTSLSLVATV